jgi:hypothetical protein
MNKPFKSIRNPNKEVEVKTKALTMEEEGVGLSFTNLE